MNARGQGLSVQLSDQRENEEALHIFREIDKSPELTQRELSSRLGISLGKVNFLVNALIRKGFIKVENFKKSSNKIAYFYCLTPGGIEEKSRMTYHFLKRKMREYEQLELEIRQLREEVQTSGAPSEEQATGQKM
jgi:EPS-associated MarR family transcriptional regulator